MAIVKPKEHLPDAGPAFIKAQSGGTPTRTGRVVEPSVWYYLTAPITLKASSVLTSVIGQYVDHKVWPLDPIPAGGSVTYTDTSLIGFMVRPLHGNVVTVG